MVEWTGGRGDASRSRSTCDPAPDRTDVVERPQPTSASTAAAAAAVRRGLVGMAVHHGSIRSRSRCTVLRDMIEDEHAPVEAHVEIGESAVVDSGRTRSPSLPRLGPAGGVVARESDESGTEAHARAAVAAPTGRTGAHAVGRKRHEAGRRDPGPRSAIDSSADRVAPCRSDLRRVAARAITSRLEAGRRPCEYRATPPPCSTDSKRKLGCGPVIRGDEPAIREHGRELIGEDPSRDLDRARRRLRGGTPGVRGWIGTRTR